MTVDISVIVSVPSRSDVPLRETLASLEARGREASLETFVVFEGEPVGALPPGVRPSTRAGAAGRNEALGLARGRWLTYLRAGDRLLAGWSAIAGEDADIVYGDSALAGTPLLLPDWSPELLLGYPYLDRGVAVRREIALRIGGVRAALGDADIYDFWLRATEEGAAIRHLPGVIVAESDGRRELAGAREAIVQALARRTTPGTAEPVAEHPGLFRIRRRFHPGLVSIIIPTRDRLDLLRPCVESVERHTSLPHEILIVDNDSRDPATLRYLESAPATVVPYPGEFNFAALNDFAAERARGA
ncbi:MAG: glycosyltransferase, partial [Chloroflexi bacterium]|nr:glycosyltransferase [Chloroflexota bacterium]